MGNRNGRALLKKSHHGARQGETGPGFVGGESRSRACSRRSHGVVARVLELFADVRTQRRGGDLRRARPAMPPEQQALRSQDLL